VIGLTSSNVAIEQLKDLQSRHRRCQQHCCRPKPHLLKPEPAADFLVLKAFFYVFVGSPCPIIEANTPLLMYACASTCARRGTEHADRRQSSALNVSTCNDVCEGYRNASLQSYNQHVGVLLVKNLVSQLLGSAAALPVCSSNVLRTYCVPDASRT
jgi:hypothetical protein